jgi:protoheme IX farnesyltransferase
LTILSQITVGNKLKDYYELTKPKIWYLLVFTAFGAALTASFLFDVPITLLTWLLLLGGVAAGSAAADTLTGYNDRDIDAIMAHKEPTNTVGADLSKECPNLWADFGSNFARLRLVYQYLGIWSDGLWSL